MKIVRIARKTGGTATVAATPTYVQQVVSSVEQQLTRTKTICVYRNRLINTTIECVYYNMIVNIARIRNNFIFDKWTDGRTDRDDGLAYMARTYAEERMIHLDACCTRWDAKTSAARGFLPLAVRTDCACGGYVGVSLSPPPRCGDPSTRLTIGILYGYIHKVRVRVVRSCRRTAPIRRLFSVFSPTDNDIHKPRRVVRQSYSE